MWSIKLRYRKQWSSFEIIILGFAGVILAGALLLMLPVASREGNVTPFTETLFTATSAACVTGLAVRDTGSYWSVFGQSVILLLIQIGGLGVVTIAVSIAMLSGRKISLMQRSTMQDAISAPKVGGIVRLTRFILKGTFGIELLGALFLLPVFFRDYGGKGIWMALFHSVSAFCNAGFDQFTGIAMFAIIRNRIYTKNHLPCAVFIMPGGICVHRIGQVGRVGAKAVHKGQQPFPLPQQPKMIAVLLQPPGKLLCRSRLCRREAGRLHRCNGLQIL